MHARMHAVAYSARKNKNRLQGCIGRGFTGQGDARARLEFLSVVGHEGDDLAGARGAEGGGVQPQRLPEDSSHAVSYTHLTLPTKA